VRITFDPSGTLDGLRDALALVRGARSVQVLGAIETGWTPEALDPVLAVAAVPVFGGLFPGVIFNGQSHARGTVVIGHDADARVAVLDCTGPIEPAERWVPALRDARTIVTYLDATCATGPLTGALFRELGCGPTWIGGGAGALDFARRPVVITPLGLRAGVAVLAGFEAAVGVGVKHGWRAFGEPMLVTEARGNDILSLDWRPAYEVYREVVEAHSGRSFEAEGFYALASKYPLMLARFGTEGIARDPLAALPDGALRCAGDVQVNATIRVAHGEFSDMLAAARAAREVAAPSGGLASTGLGLTIDCISRALLLGDRLQEELEALRVPGHAQAGALTIGEIASSGDHFLEFHNKTTVLAVTGPAGAKT
jgi:hypothetical protein